MRSEEAAPAALITGASRGLGRAVAERLVGDGRRVAMVDVDAAAIRAAAEGLEGAIPIAADVSVEADVERAFADAELELGPIRLVHANAGILGGRTPLADVSAEEFDRVLAVNTRGVFLTLRELVRRRGGVGPASVVVTASTAAHRAYPGYSVYAASKHAALGLVRGAARDYGPEGIRVNAVAPGAMATEMAREVARHLSDSDSDPSDFTSSPGMTQQIEEIPLGRMASPEDVAAVVVWLLGDEARHVNGSSYAVDGGVLA